MPTKYHLSHDKNHPEFFVLKVPFLHEYDNIISENYTLKVILPEGSTKIKVYLPFEVDSIERDLHYSTLDYIGRPVIIIKKANVVSLLHKKEF